MRHRKHYILLLTFILLLPFAAAAHIIPYELDGNRRLGTWDLFKL